MELKNKIWLITGGASGLGAATAEYLVAQQAAVILVDLNVAQGEILQQRLGQQATFYAVDVTNEQEVSDLFSQIRNQHGTIHGLINCAGIAPSSKIFGRQGIHDLALFQKVLNINVIGSFNTIRFATQMMAENECDGTVARGVIINTASVAAYEGQIGQAAYAASKGAIVAMTLPLARELAQYAIRVMTIAPGIMQTPMLEGFPESVQQALGQMVPFPSRLAKPQEFAALVGHIIENEYLNGEVIRLDGALRMAAK